MADNIHMSALGEGECGKIDLIPEDCRLNSRFADLGIIKGTRVKCIRRKKGTAAYSIRQTVFAIRDADTEKIIISLCGGD